MNKLSLSKINVAAPYKVWYEDGEYRFITDNDILYALGFDKDYMGTFLVYWFNLINRSSLRSPGDTKLEFTVSIVIEEFFRCNPDVLLYLCDSANGQQAMRARLFKRWFSKYDKDNVFDILSAVINDEGEDNYVSMIIQKSHPHYDEIVYIFSSEIQTFSDMK